MNSVVQAKIRRYLQERLGCRPTDCGAVMFNMCNAAQMAGHDLNERFAEAGLGAGPDAAVASGIVKRAIGSGGGSPVTDEIIKTTVRRWIRTTRKVGR